MEGFMKCNGRGTCKWKSTCKDEKLDLPYCCFVIYECPNQVN